MGTASTHARMYAHVYRPESWHHLRGSSHHGPRCCPKALYNLWLVVEPLRFTSRNKCMLEWSWSARSSNDIFKGLHYPLTQFKGFCSGRGKRSALVRKGKGPWQRNIVMMKFWWNFFGGKEDGDKRRPKNMVKLDWFFIFPFPKLPFLGIYETHQHVHMLVHGHSSWSTFGLHLVKGPKGFVHQVFLRNRTMEKGHLPWPGFMSHGVNGPSYNLHPKFP